MNTVVSFQNSLNYLYTEIKHFFKYIVLMPYYCLYIIFTLVQWSLVKILTLIKNMEFEKSQNQKVLKL